MKKIFSILFVLCFCFHAKSQTAGGYLFNVDSTTAYSAISGTDVFDCPNFYTGDTSVAVKLSKSFTFEGVAYDSVRIGYAGWVTFGSNDPLKVDGGFASNIFIELANVPGAIAVSSYGAYGPFSSSGTCASGVSMSSTADEFIVQWQNIQMPSNVPEDGIYNIYFQLRLEYSTGIIKLCYGGVNHETGGGQQVHVGIRGNGLDFNTYVNARAAGPSGDEWTRSTRAQDAGADCSIQGMYSGLTYIYTPGNCFGAKDLDGYQATGNSITLKWNKTSSIDGYEFAATEGLFSGAPNAGTFTADTSGKLTGLTSTSIYKVWVRGKCSNSYTTWSTETLRTVCDPVTTPYLETYPNSSAISYTGSGAHLYFPCNDVDPDNPSSSAYTTQWQPSYVGEDGMWLDNIGNDDTVSSWYFTKQVQLNAGTTYRIYFQAERTGFYITQNTPLKIQMSNYPDTLSLVGSALLNVLFTQADDQTIDTFALFTPSVSGLYCAGFNSSSSTALGAVDVLQVGIVDNATIQTSCTQNVLPANDTVIHSGDQFTFSWNKVTGAEQYTVYAPLSPYFTEQLVANGGDTSYSIGLYAYNTTDTIHWYVVPRFYGMSATGCDVNSSVIYIQPASLPLTLLNFTAEAAKNEILLQWQTTNEVNTSHFEIQRSADAVTFSAIGKIRAAGSNASVKTYNFTDVQPNEGENYYRLKMIDKDGKFTYSNIIQVNLNNASSIKIFPNPVADILNIQLPFAGNIDLKISDALGKIINHQTFTAGNNSFSKTINTSKLTSGLYYVIITANGKTETKLFIKK